MNGIILFSHSHSGTVLEAFSDLNVRRLLSPVTYTGWMEAQFTENPFLAHETLNRELYVLFKLCNYHPNLIPGWIFSPVRGQYSSKVHKLGWEFVLPTFLKTLCFYSRHHFKHPLFGNPDQQTDYFRAVLIAVLCGTSLVAAQEVTVNPILF